MSPPTGIPLARHITRTPSGSRFDFVARDDLGQVVAPTRLRSSCSRGSLGPIPPSGRRGRVGSPAWPRTAYIPISDSWRIARLTFRGGVPLSRLDALLHERVDEPKIAACSRSLGDRSWYRSSWAPPSARRSRVLRSSCSPGRMDLPVRGGSASARSTKYERSRSSTSPSSMPTWWRILRKARSPSWLEAHRWASRSSIARPRIGSRIRRMDRSSTGWAGTSSGRPREASIGWRASSPMGSCGSIPPRSRSVLPVKRGRRRRPVPSAPRTAESRATSARSAWVTAGVRPAAEAELVYLLSDATHAAFCRAPTLVSRL
jgi:hypothetical protein